MNPTVVFFLFWAYLRLSLPEQVLRLLIFWGIVLRLHGVITETGVSHLRPSSSRPEIDTGRWDGKAGEEGESVPVLRLRFCSLGR